MTGIDLKLWISSDKYCSQDIYSGQAHIIYYQIQIQMTGKAVTTGIDFKWWIPSNNPATRVYHAILNISSWKPNSIPCLHVIVILKRVWSKQLLKNCIDVDNFFSSRFRMFKWLVFYCRYHTVQAIYRFAKFIGGDIYKPPSIRRDIAPKTHTIASQDWTQYILYM